MTPKHVPAPASHASPPKEALLDYYFLDFAACPLPELKKSKHPWELVEGKNALVKLAASRIEGEVHPTVVVKGNVAIGKGSVVEPYTVIEGPCVIGENVTIRPHAWVRPVTVIGNGCVIGKGVELKNALLFNGAKIGTNCFVGDSVLGKGARIGSGTILGNRRFDQQTVQVKIGGEKFSTGSDKFGCILGEYARLGANVTTAPGTLVGAHTWVTAPSIQGFIPADKLLKSFVQASLQDKPRIELKGKDAKGKV